VPSLTGAYIVSRRGAQKLLGRRIPFGRPIDVDLRHWWECDLRVLGVDPYPVRGAPSSRFSTIEDRAVVPERRRRLARIWLQLRYSVLNAWANWHARPLDPRRGGRSGALPRRREWPAQDVR
jgi:glycosyl transferase family 25